MFIELVRIESLSNNSYVVGSEESGVCAVIDPARDVDRYIAIAAQRGVTITHALETHIHNDFISGCRELVAETGCQRVGRTTIPLVPASRERRDRPGRIQASRDAQPGPYPRAYRFRVGRTG